jgi:hypothetical protein
MPPDKRNSLSGAVTECVAICIRSTTPLTRLAEFVGKLRQEGWSDADVLSVEKAALHVLAGVLDSIGTDDAPEPIR